MTQPRTLLEICGLSVKYPNGVSALEDINLDICEGDLVALIGPNGAGKSTLLKAILGLIKPTSGSIKLLGCADLGKTSKASATFPKPRLSATKICPSPYTKPS